MIYFIHSLNYSIKIVIKNRKNQTQNCNYRLLYYINHYYNGGLRPLNERNLHQKTIEKQQQIDGYIFHSLNYSIKIIIKNRKNQTQNCDYRLLYKPLLQRGAKPPSMREKTTENNNK